MYWIQFNTKQVRTRKDHHCCGCNRLFRKGTMMERTSGKWSSDNTVITTHTCGTCMEFGKEHMDFHDYSDQPLPDHWPEVNPEAYVRTALKLLDYEAAGVVAKQYGVELNKTEGGNEGTEIPSGDDTR